MRGALKNLTALSVCQEFTGRLQVPSSRNHTQSVYIRTMCDEVKNPLIAAWLMTKLRSKPRPATWCPHCLLPISESAGHDVGIS